MDDNGNIYAIQSCEFYINVLDTNGMLKRSFGNQPSYFKRPPPIRDLKSFMNKSQKENEEFFNSFTPVEKLILMNNEYVLISCRIPEKLRADGGSIC